MCGFQHIFYILSAPSRFVFGAFCAAFLFYLKCVFGYLSDKSQSNKLFSFHTHARAHAHVHVHFQFSFLHFPLYLCFHCFSIFMCFHVLSAPLSAHPWPAQFQINVSFYFNVPCFLHPPVLTFLLFNKLCVCLHVKLYSAVIK